ncbi:hypothetical protein Acr_00g0011780 [Actinidia rufa]|uniref:Uncharacterized protein n=1 Tax=Actinidia rufa TaxID=165716 RepID=A0A7J0D9R0_9ERIC|nr:hypothetical protein Acr_00g0011780 [Actinidia rufa]
MMRNMIEIYSSEVNSEDEGIDYSSHESNEPSISSDRISNISASIMEEVEATIEMGKKLGLQFEGNEEEVRQKLIQMELEENMDRPNNNGGVAAI